MQQHLVRRLSLIACLVGLAAIALVATGTAARVVTAMAVLDRLQPGTLGIVLALGALSALLSGVIWWRLALRLGHRMPFRAALAAYLNAGLAGYVVSIAGPALGSAVTLRRHGVGPGRAVLLTLIANALGFCGILMWAPLGLVLLSRGGMDTALPILGRYGPAAIAGSIAALVVVMLLTLRVLAAAAGSGSRLALRLLRRGHPAEEGTFPALRSRQLLALVPYSAASWVVGALALYVVLGAMSHGASLPLGSVLGAAVIAAALGSLAFFAPEGVGVKDGVLVVLLSHATGLPVSTGVAATLTVRALDPLTKLGLLGLLAVTNGVLARRVVNATTRLSQVMASAPRQWGRIAMGRRVTMLGASVLTLVSVLTGYGVFAHADPDIASPGALTPPAFVQSVSYLRPPIAVDTAGIVRRSNL